jgi:ribosomal protein S18 acetylase RimI-like enzyme
VAVLQEVELDTLLELRERVLTPGHPGRPVVWPYDNDSAAHCGMFVDALLVGCVSLTPQQMPLRPAARPYHLHSMAVEPAYQGTGLGRLMLAMVLDRLRACGADLVWATARPSAVGFYQRCRFEVGEEMRIPPTNVTMRYIWCVLDVPRPQPPHRSDVDEAGSG